MEAWIGDWLRENVGGEVRRLSRQSRWRPVWLADVERDGEFLPLMVRGERIDSPLVFPLRHEMTLQQVLGDCGIPVPRVHGWIDRLPAYVMERVDGRPDFTEASPAEHDEVMREYMAILARIHRLPLEPFDAAGIIRASAPSGAGRIGMERFEAVYRSTKKRPDPYLEFGLGWLARHPLDTAGRESAIVWDSGQFHHSRGKVTAVLDVEIGHIGDPMMDLAAMRMRDTVLHLGKFSELYEIYEQAGGFPVDIDAVEHHHIAFTMSNQLSFHGALADPSPGSDYMTNLQWCSETNLHTVEALAERLGIVLEEPPPADPQPSPTDVAQHQLIRLLRTIETDDDYVRYQLRSAFRLARYVRRAAEIGNQITEWDLDDLEPLLGHRPRTWQEGDAELEEFVLQDDGKHDEELIRLFYRRFMRQKTTLGPPGSAMAAHHVVQSFRG